MKDFQMKSQSVPLPYAERLLSLDCLNSIYVAGAGSHLQRVALPSKQSRLGFLPAPRLVQWEMEVEKEDRTSSLSQALGILPP